MLLRQKILLGSFITIAIIAATGCKTPSAIAAPNASSSVAAGITAQQLIIKFRPNTISCDAPGIAHLSSVTHLPLEYVRSMSGEACVIRQLTVRTEDLLRDQDLLRHHSDVEWLELDAKKKAL